MSVKEVDFPVSDREWGGHGVISHKRMLWWVDLSWGLLSCDLFAEEPVLIPQKLPPASVLEASTDDIRNCRCIGISDGKLQYLEVDCDSMVVSVWTLGTGLTDDWKHNCTASFSDIWGDQTYKKTGLPPKLPVVALIHPKNPNSAYFILYDVVFGVDLQSQCTFCKFCLPMESQLPEGPSYNFLPWFLSTVVIKSTSELRNEASAILEANKSIPSSLKVNLREIVVASKIVEESLACLGDCIDGKIDGVHLEANEEMMLSAFRTNFSCSVVMLVGEESGSYNVAEKELAEDIISRLVASIAHDIDEFAASSRERIVPALGENHIEMVELIRTHHFMENLEIIGFEDAQKILDSNQELRKSEFLKALVAREHCLFSIELFACVLLAKLQEWQVQFNYLVEAREVAADSATSYEYNQDDILFPKLSSH